ncbi:MAG: signal recognition particle-docking protein FtsY [Limosilactobacillus sp.]|jgi:fused signal recognition particle receptor|uniref:signal recognition particle-docking protein FtsY n=1 Tax=Limosilactobacillus sp. TaxID=2773925 RepID=UPI0025C4A3C6|nr:signal recognition particle-docking protein FtsY [Limosilactobacillus sp.]MCI1975324.1 signal recognition particle-docking protein FtsY [Limosilactobacillus sp.]MCI2031035.1 signal recognition particle-docking protein FtsY [Limosilactobacillus sp.]
MGLFDIFRRHKKHEDKQEEQSQAPKPEEQADREVTSDSGTEIVPQSSADEEPRQENVSEAQATPSSAEKVEQDSSETVSEASVAEDSAEQTTDTLAESATNSAEAVASTEENVSQTVESAESETTSEASEPAMDDAEGDSDEAKEPTTEVAEEETPEKKYDQGLEKSRTGFGARLNRFLANFRHVDEDFFDDLEDMLIESDVGYDMAMKLSDELREEVKLQNAKSKQDVSNVIVEKMVELYEKAGKNENPNLNFAKEGPTVIMFVGVNGAGKTTTIGKMAALFKGQGKKVLLAAADTFRAGATEQLDVWAKRDGVDIVTGPENGDPAAVVFDAVQKAKKENYDILFVDTAGRLQNKVNLMKELAKMKRILTREIPDAPHEVLLVLDATTGQNALNQAKLFKESTDVTGIVLTKLDGTARGGIVLAIRNELHLPVKYVGLGEKVDDLQKFNASEFVYGLFKGLVEVD